MEQLTVSSCSDLIYNSGLQIYKDTTGNVFSRPGFTEKGVESIISSANCLVRRHLSIRLDAMLETVKLPACISDLDTSLTDVDGDKFSHLALLWLTSATKTKPSSLELTNRI
mmetsp:Transcript_25003/g.43172  ORF Transcript_25003/g.43172 Transcript_25003/m.43172 type:complete len:112 (-) Transcript_25003:53-388(-)